ncbi:DUF1684 domain-containing protein [Streptomyces cavernae]|uniref:DUF1684 domain-containing protein n=1 Tax=Streptomyces cavernae TaxID=2259034 RepID=UPI000FEBFDEA|nr:DUF1684 domain-containing protein [Streptomyces cavernae]
MTAPQRPADFDAWLDERWKEIAGVNGKGTVAAKAVINGQAPRAIDDLPGMWATTATGALSLTARAADGVCVNGEPVDGTTDVPSGATVELPGGLTAFAGGADGSYGVVVMDQTRVRRTGLSGIDRFPYDPAWVFEGRYQAREGRHIEVERLTAPRSLDLISAPVDVVVTIHGTEYVLAVLEESPGRRLVIFTDETSGDSTPTIGRWLVLPLLEPGSPVSIDFNKATLSYHHLNQDVFTCPLAPPGNDLPLRIEAGERALTHATDQG